MVPSEIYGELTFNRLVMRQKLSKTVYQKLMSTLEDGEPLDQSIAAEVAHAMKEWALENGASHFTHWFQPLRGGTAEKHDSFISFDEDGKLIERFSAEQLIQSEPDASSFPSGGMRSTFEARGYTAWDPTSPAFLLESQKTKTLVIPSVYMSWTGHVLDIKTPLLRSQKALETAAIKLQRLLGNRHAKRLNIFAGPEQEYFLFSKKLFNTRPDLRICHRTLFGAPPARGQQMEEHYFGGIKESVLAFMEDLDKELYRREIPAKTRHNEVSPNQFEIAPLYELQNLASDHNLVLMDVIRKVAGHHNMVAILHEKPLAGVNGSGKHVNYSLGDNTVKNYFEPSKSPHKNLTFLLSVGAILLGVTKYGGLLRASIADAGNDHRLGANEAPPAIMSVFLGQYLSDILSELEGISKITEKLMAEINLGIHKLPRIAKDTSDRNRTSPIAFTGNKFEFRAVGSSANIGEASTIINLMMAYGLDQIRRQIEKLGGNVKESAFKILREVIKSTHKVRFEGNNYESSWHKEAVKRGLPNDTNTPVALKRFLESEAIHLFEKYKVLTQEEVHSKIEIKLETYTKIKLIECRTMIDISKTMVLPALSRHLGSIARAVGAVTAAGLTNSGLSADVEDLDGLYGNIKQDIQKLEQVLATCVSENRLEKQAERLATKAVDAMNQLRISVDEAEGLIAHDLWPMAKYQCLLDEL